MLDLSRLHDAIRHEGGVSRRLLLGYAATLAALPWLAERAAAAGGATTRPAFPSDPFALGVASGDPDHVSVVIWTRLAPLPLQTDGGMRPKPVEVRWEVAEDDAMRKVVRSGTAVASPDLGHSVHVEVDGLRPDRWYWYRFRTGGADSPVGRTRTLPDPAAMPGELRFAFASCQHYEQGLFTAYEGMARDELDLVLHLGDYIYEYEGKDKRVRRHVGRETETLADYRVRHAQYRSDPLLQAAHARCPWLVTWDDHEFDNNYANDVQEPPPATTRPAATRPATRPADPAAFLRRRAAAYRAYYEAMPLRRASLPRGPDMQLYRRCAYGRLADLLILDTRQYRTPLAHGGRNSPLDAAALDLRGSILGATQRAWLEASLAKSPATWNVLAQQVMMGMVDRTAGDEQRYSMDQWPGYARERTELVQFLADRRVSNPVVLAGDIHSNWVNDLRPDDRRPDQPVVATEFVGTSISSGGNGVDKPAGLEKLLAENPCVRYHNRERGYVRCSVKPTCWWTDYVVVDDVTKPGGRVQSRMSFAVEAGRPGAQPA